MTVNRIRRQFLFERSNPKRELVELVGDGDSFGLTFRLGLLVIVDVAAQRHDVVSKNSRTGVTNDGGDVLRLSCNVGLLAEGLELTANFARKIGETREVRLHRVELPHRLFLAATVLEDSGCFLNKTAAVLGCRRQDRIETTLTHDDVHLATQTRIGQQFLDIEKSAGLAVDGVFRLTVAEQDSRNRHFGVFDRQSPVRVVDCQRDFGTTERAAGGRSRKNDVVHFAAAQRLGALLAHDPRESVNDVRLPRPVGADDSGDPLFELEGRRLSERLEALEGQGLQIHLTIIANSSAEN
ncbi:unannotated protein [freshwater metagenome]|uniref:Unannotated protein n=1 Tax=freshwater metagenome TaxID=449393 RepID=A0A6J6JDP5_9ZZZZ